MFYVSVCVVASSLSMVWCCSTAYWQYTYIYHTESRAHTKISKIRAALEFPYIIIIFSSVLCSVFLALLNKHCVCAVTRYANTTHSLHIRRIIIIICTTIFLTLSVRCVTIFWIFSFLSWKQFLIIFPLPRARLRYVYSLFLAFEQLSMRLNEVNILAILCNMHMSVICDSAATKWNANTSNDMRKYYESTKHKPRWQKQQDKPRECLNV